MIYFRGFINSEHGSGIEQKFWFRIWIAKKYESREPAI
jgi:hypothetical protein